LRTHLCTNLLWTSDTRKKNIPVVSVSFHYVTTTFLCNLICMIAAKERGDYWIARCKAKQTFVPSLTMLFSSNRNQGHYLLPSFFRFFFYLFYLLSSFFSCLLTSASPSLLHVFLLAFCCHFCMSVSLFLSLSFLLPLIVLFLRSLYKLLK
jgi:hypothetical protein